MNVAFVCPSVCLVTAQSEGSMRTLSYVLISWVVWLMKGFRRYASSNRAATSGLCPREALPDNRAHKNQHWDWPRVVPGLSQDSARVGVGVGSGLRQGWGKAGAGLTQNWVRFHLVLYQN